MRAGFFASKPFLIAAGLSIVVLAGAGWALSQSLNATVDVESTSCAPATGAGFAAPPVQDTGAKATAFGYERVVTYTFNASGVTNGTAFACTPYGDIEVRPSADGNGRIVFTIKSDRSGADTVRSTGVDALVRAEGGRLDVLAWHSELAQRRTLFDTEGASVRISAELPALPWKLEVETRYGDLDLVRTTLAGGSRLDTSYGDVLVADVELLGDFTVTTSYGDVDFGATKVATGSLSLDSSYGDLAVGLPRQADAGYDVDASTSYGDAVVQIGETERYERNKDGDTVRAKSAGFATKAAQLGVTATTSYGDIDILLR